MIERRNRVAVGLVGLLLLAAGVLSDCVGAGVFGTARSNHSVFNSTLIRWWDEGGWKSFAVVVAIGVVVALIGLRLVMQQFRRNDGRHHSPNLVFPPSEGVRGETVLKASALGHNLETDLERIPDVHGAAVDLFGHYPDIELRAILDVGDHADLEQLPAQVDEALDRVAATTGARLSPVQVTVRFKDVDRERQIT